MRCLSSAVKQTGASCPSNEQGYDSDKQPHFPCCLAAGNSIVNSITTELWPVVSRLPEGISSHSSQRFDTTKQKERDFSAHTRTKTVTAPQVIMV